jgi:RimJ/RimL family protein N-acetyltransferase
VSTAANTFILPDPPLGDERFLLREPAAADVERIYEACQDPAIQRFTFVPVPYERHHATGWFADMARAREAGEQLSFAIEDRADGAFCGMASLLRPDWPNRTVEVGYWIAPAARRRGAASHAARLLAHHALRDLGFARVVADIDVENAGSMAAAERAGFVREGTARSAIEAKGRRWTLALYSMLPEDLDAA